MICQMTLIPTTFVDQTEAACFPLLDADGPLFAENAETVSKDGGGFKDGPKVYSHCRYQVRLSGWEEPPSLSELQEAAVRINDEDGEIQWSRSKKAVFVGTFTSPNGGLIFRDTFGFAEIALSLRTGGKRRYLRSGLLPVMVRESALNASVQEMAEYVYARQEEFLFSGDPKSRIQGSLKKPGYRNIFTTIALAREAAAVFASCYPYFKANCRFQIQKTPRVLPLERLQAITPATLQYTACHPEELELSVKSTGIRWRGRNYQPRRSLGTANTVSMETYENQVLLGFLKTLLQTVRRLRYDGGVLLAAASAEEEREMIFSPRFLLAPTRRRLAETVHPLQQLSDRLLRLLGLYSKLLPIAAPELHTTPRLTAVFRSVPEYNRIYTCCRQWFQFGLFDLHGERMILPFLKIPDLYEVYILARLFETLKARNWSWTDSKRLPYPEPENRNPAGNPPKWPAPSRFGNVFTFRKNGAALTVFYQPVIYSGKDALAGTNGLELCRNTSISYKDEPDPCTEKDAASGYYYRPDFVLKLQTDRQTRYIIADAKFASLPNVRRHQLPALVYKYLFSISPIGGGALSGLCIFCGQAVGDNACRNIRDLQPDARPFAVVLTFPGGSDGAPLTDFLNQYLF